MKKQFYTLFVLIVVLLLPSLYVSKGTASDAAIDASFNPLTFVETQYDAGLEGAHSVVVSPDDKHVYTVSLNDDAVSVFARDESAGSLRFVEVARDGVAGVDGLDDVRTVAISPDGGHIYVASFLDDAVAVFSRDASTGKLTFLEVHKDGVGGITSLDGAASVVVSADDKHVYVSSGSDKTITVFERDRSTGLLTLIEFHQDGVSGVDGLAGTHNLSLSPDGNHIYATGTDDQALAVFSRSAITGELTFVDVYKESYVGIEGLSSALGVTVSPDGKNVYVTSLYEDSLAVFGRDSATGLLTIVEVERDGINGVDGLDHPTSVRVSPDDNYLYITGAIDDAVAIFERAPTTGVLSYLGMVQNGMGDIEELHYPSGISFNADGSSLYVAAFRGALLAFDRHVTSGALTLVDIQRSGDGLEGAVGVAASSDNCLYVAGNNDDAITFFKRDAATGTLTYQDKRTDEEDGVDGLDGTRAVAVSSNGEHIYVAGHDEDAVAVFSRDNDCAWLDFVNVYKDTDVGVDGLDGPQALALSLDDLYLYVASEIDDAIAIFSRNVTTGELSYAGMVQDGVLITDGLDGAYALAISPDGLNLYAASYVEDAVAVFARNPANGALLYAEMHQDGVDGVDGLNGANSIAVSPDGNHVYAAGRNDNAIAVFIRDTGSGGILDYAGLVRDGVGGVDGLNGARALVLPPDGRQLYVASQFDDALAVFSRDESSGLLTFVAAHKDGVNGVDGLDAADGIAVSPSGGHVYVAGYGDDAVAVFRRFGVYLPLVVR